MDLRVTLPDEVILRLKRRMKTDSTKELMEQAFTMLDWAVGEAAEGRIVASAQLDGSKVKELVMTSLTKAKAP